MGLRCLLGHDFDEPETERERNEEGNEVVVTVREVKTCKRCGEKQVVSENKEITSIDQLRESAGTEPAGATPGAEPADAGESADWSTDELSTDDGVSAESEPTDAATPTEGAESVTASDETEDPIERGVADIIEQAEKDDDMLEQTAAESEPESDAAEDEEDVPVHPGQRGSDEDEAESPDAESDDGVILDEDEESRPEEARKQWEEEASPEEVPGQDLSVSEPSAPDGEDAEIIDGSAAESTPAPEPEPTESDRAPATGTSSAVEDEDAEIMDAGPETSAPEPDTATEPEPAADPEREETGEGHMPWPDAPGEDEGHDASVPDGEPADVDFGGGLTPTDPESEESESEPEPEPKQAEIIDSTPDRSNGHRTADGESGDASAASSAPSANVDLERSSRDADMEYLCPECGLTRDVGNSSMRAGDICPECRRGYITEQQKAE